MTELAWSTPPADPTAIVTPKKCRRHEWGVWVGGLASGSLDAKTCRRCGAVRDEQKARRGKSARRLGHDGERRSERKYGWRKVGEYGGITDLEGTLAIVQQKTSRRLPPPLWRGVFSALAARAGGRIPLLLLSYVRQGVPSDDFIVIRAADWLALHGRDEPDRWTHIGEPAFPYDELMSPDDPQRRTL